MEFEDWLEEVKSYSANEFIRELIERNKNLFFDYFEEDMTAAQAYMMEWG